MRAAASRAASVACCLLASACSRAHDAPAPPAPPTASASTTTHASLAAAAPAPAAASAPSASASSEDTLVSARSIGNTSVVFKLTFASGAKAAYKPRSKRGRDRYQGEIAAYRLAQALDVDNVPAVSFRRIAFADLERALAAQPQGRELARQEIVADADGTVPGALIPWIEQLDFLRLESEPWKSKWRAWLLTPEPVAEGDRALAAQVAAMIVFDGVTGNWDRWSGANVGFDAKAHKLLFVDNDGAFMTPTPAPFEQQRGLVRMLKKVPRALVDKLRGLDPPRMKAALGEEATGAPLLSDAALRDVETRRRALLAVVDARVKELGPERVYAFP
jgi:hypothetical protein